MVYKYIYLSITERYKEWWSIIKVKWCRGALWAVLEAPVVAFRDQTWSSSSMNPNPLGHLPGIMHEFVIDHMTDFCLYVHSDSKPEQSFWVWAPWGRWSGFYQWKSLCRPHLPRSHQAHGECDGLSPNAHQKVQMNLTRCFLLKLYGNCCSFCNIFVIHREVGGTL